MAFSNRSIFSSDSGGSPGGSPGHRTYMCEVCGRLFTSPQSLGAHIKLHSKEDPPSSTPPQSGVYNPPGAKSNQTVSFKGVRYREWDKSWVAEIRPSTGTTTLWLGKYSTPEEAAHAYDVASTYFGSEKPLNFDGHPIYDQIPRILTGLHGPDLALELRLVVKKYGKLAMESGTLTTVPMVPTSKPKFSTESGGSPGGSSGTTSWKYKGVSDEMNEWVAGLRVLESNKGKWVAEIRVPEGNKGNSGMRIWLGDYPTPLEAAFAYDVAVMCLGGGESMLNFHHPIFIQIPRILPDLSAWFFELECRSVVREFWKLANSEAENSVPMTLVGEPKDNTDSGSSPGGVPGTSRECPDLCPECGKTFLASQSMLLHLMNHWENQKFSPPSRSSRDSSGASRSLGMGSRWWSMYKGVQYVEVDAPRVVTTRYSEELRHGKWAVWIWLSQNYEYVLGVYSTMLEAAYAYDMATACLGGKPLLNFHRHPVYELIPRISPNLPYQAIASRLKMSVKKFGKLVMEGGYYGGPKQEMTMMEFLKMSRVRELEPNVDGILNSSMELASDLDTFQKNKRCRFNMSLFHSSGVTFLEDIPIADQNMEMLPPHPSVDISNDETLLEGISMANQNMEMLPPYPNVDISNDETLLETILKVDKNMEMLPPYPSVDISKACPTIEPTNTKNKQSYQPLSLGPCNMLLGSPNGALKFTMADLNTMTGKFSKNLTVGQAGGSRSVYQGQLQDGTTVAVKRIKKNGKNVLEIGDTKDFQTEANILFKETHLNLVRLLGFFEDENELIFVTEYVTNGNLRQHLDGVPYGVILDMSRRCRISLDVAAALRHLHNQTKDDLDIIHRDIKSSDVLITNDFRAKVIGLGLSRCSPCGDACASSSSTQVKETSGDMANKHLTTHLKEKNDVYSFGELLVEVFTRRRLFGSSLTSDEFFTPRWVLKQCEEGRLMDIIDPKITPTSFNLKILEQIFKLADSCLALEESNRPTVGDIFWDLSFIVGHYFGDLKDESTSKGNKYEGEKEQEWDLEACIEPNLQTLCLEESKALKRQEQTQHLDKIDSVDPSFMPTKPHSSLFVEGFGSNKVQTNIQLGTQLEVDSKQVTRQASELLIAKEDHPSPSFTNIIPDMFQLKSDETYTEMLQEEIAKLGYISRLLNQGDEFEQNLTNTGKTSFFLYFNEKDNVFEFYFKNYQEMASIVGVGLEYAKVVLEDGWRVTVQEISKPNWDDAWKNFDSSSSTMKVTIPESLGEGMDNMEDSQACIPSGQCLLLDLAQYFILKKAIASFLPRASMTHANTDSGTSSSPSSQDIARSSSSSDQMPSRFFQAMKNIFSSREASNQLKTKNVDGTPVDPSIKDDVKIDTTVHLKLLSGGCLYARSNLLDATILDDKELEELTSQLDNTICLEMMFKFLNEDDKKEIHVIVGPISFQFQEENEDNYETSGRFGWYHKLLEVSFGPVNAHCSEIGSNHNALDIIDWKMSKSVGSSNTTMRGTSNSMNGGVQGSIPHILTLSGSGSLGWSSSECESFNVGDSLEKPSQMTIGGFDIFPKRYQLSSTLKYAYRAPDHNFEIDLEKISYEDYRKLHLNLLPMCSPQDVKFEGTWYPKDLDYNPQVLVEYSLNTSRLVQMTSKEISKKVVKKPWIKRCGHLKIQKESNEPLKYTQKYTRSFFLNHAMTHLNGEKYKVEEFLHQRPLNQREPKTHLEDRSCFAPQWCANPLVKLNSELDYQP